jgi:hypothetical protein
MLRLRVRGAVLPNQKAPGTLVTPVLAALCNRRGRPSKAPASLLGDSPPVAWAPLQNARAGLICSKSDADHRYVLNAQASRSRRETRRNCFAPTCDDLPHRRELLIVGGRRFPAILVTSAYMLGAPHGAIRNANADASTSRKDCDAVATVRVSGAGQPREIP